MKIILLLLLIVYFVENSSGHEITFCTTSNPNVGIEVYNRTLQESRVNAIYTLYNNLIYPTAGEIIRSGGLSQDVFDINATGRINSIGIFVNLQDTVEYFYALAGPVSGIRVNGTSYVQSVDIKVLDIVGPRVSVQVNINFTQYNEPDSWHYVAMIGWLVFKPNTNRVLWYDLTLLRLDQYADVPVSGQPTVIEQTCAATTALCTGDNLQYSSYDECVDFMTNDIEFGTWSDAWSDTVVCRSLHIILAQVRPWYHCPHAGPSGGGKCIFHPYNEWLETEFVTDPEPDNTIEPPCITI